LILIDYYSIIGCKSDTKGAEFMDKNITLKCVNGIKGFVKRIRFRMKLWAMDDMWRYTGGGCFGDYPPSFYYTHTPEEVKRIKQEEITRLKAMLDEFCEENGLEKTDWNKT
jgi:hypothetical protein